MYDLVVIGGGSGGVSVASAAAKVGATVALIEKDRSGADSYLEAGVPSKGLVQAAKLVHKVRDAGRFGVKAGPIAVDFAAVLGRVRALATELAQDSSAEVLKSMGIEVFHGSAAFDAYDTILVDGKTPISGQKFVIATGARPAVPAIPGLIEAGYVDSHSIWSLSRLPASVIVIGSEPIGLEFAQSLSRLGAKVTVLSSAPRILPRDDVEASELVSQLLTAEGLTIKSGVEVTKVEAKSGLKVCKFKDAATGQSGEVSAEEILIAAGRLANVDSLNLDAIGVHADAQHGIEVDDCLQTHSARVYAIGDVLLRNTFAHFAEAEAAVAFQNAVLRSRKKMDYSGIPWTTFVDPEVASVGISLAQAEEERRPVQTYRVSYDQIDRARIDGCTNGFAKVIATPAGKILGATVVGEDASMIVQEFVLAMKKGHGLGDFAQAPVYPTYAAVASHLAKQVREARLHQGYMQSVLRLFFGFTRRAAAVNGAQSPASETTAGHVPTETHALAEHAHGH